LTMAVKARKAQRSAAIRLSLDFISCPNS
jgi:hypothetical protein